MYVSHIIVTHTDELDTLLTQAHNLYITEHMIGNEIKQFIPIGHACGNTSEDLHYFVNSQSYHSCGMQYTYAKNVGIGFEKNFPIFNYTNIKDGRSKKSYKTRIGCTSCTRQIF